jgi:hypothetical protein
VFERRYVAEVGVGVALIRDGNGTRSVETVLRYRGAAQAELLRALKALRAEQAATARAIAAEPARARFGWNVSTGAAAKPEQGTGHAARRPNPNEPKRPAKPAADAPAAPPLEPLPAAPARAQPSEPGTAIIPGSCPQARSSPRGPEGGRKPRDCQMAVGQGALSGAGLSSANAYPHEWQPNRLGRHVRALRRAGGSADPR